MQELKRKPIFGYNGESGPVPTQGRKNVSRAVFAKKDGDFILLRGKRNSVIGQSIADVIKKSEWQALWS